MSRIHQNITFIPRPEKLQFEREKTTNANIKMNQILELSDKNFQAIIIKLIEQVITNSFEKIESLTGRIPEQSGNDRRQSL